MYLAWTANPIEAWILANRGAAALVFLPLAVLFISQTTGGVAALNSGADPTTDEFSQQLAGSLANCGVAKTGVMH